MIPLRDIEGMTALKNHSLNFCRLSLLRTASSFSNYMSSQLCEIPAWVLYQPGLVRTAMTVAPPLSRSTLVTLKFIPFY